MTTIYLVQDITLPQAYYFVPDAATQTAGEAIGIPNSTWIIGDINAANAQLAIAQQNFESSSLWPPHFSQIKSIGKDPDGYNIWIACNITTEPSNTDTLYELFCDVQSGFQSATGTTDALQIFENQKQAVLVWADLSAVTVLNNLPQAIK